MKMWMSIAGIALAGALVGSTNASMIVAGFQDKDLVPIDGPNDRANISPPQQSALFRAQGFTVTDSISLDSVSILANSPNPQGNTVSLFITDGLGSAEGAGNQILFQQTYTISSADAGGNLWHSFDLGVVLPGAGEYFLVVGANDAQGFEVRRLSQENSVGLTIRGGLFEDINDPPDPNSSDAFFFDDGNVLAMQFFGSAIPAPGSFALIGLSGLILAGRRRR